MSRNPHKLIIAGGGTGGHFYCGLAFAQKYVSKYPRAEIIFIGVRKGIEGRHKFSDKRMKVEFIQAMGFKGENPLNKMISLLGLAFGVLGMCFRLIKHRPRFVLGVGGYASASTMFAAILLKPFMNTKPVVVDQNSIPGALNRFLSKFLPAYGPFPYPGFRTMELPVRDEVDKAVLEAPEAQWPPRRILVMGGSQGALGLNKAWIRILSELAKADEQYEIFHQAGSSSIQNVQAAYNEFRVPAEVFAFSTELHNYISKADLVICRAGALSILECIAFQRPTVLVPFPFAADNHQMKNAQAVQHPSWILAESRLDWKNLQTILKSREPRVPSIKQKAATSWRSLFQA